MAREGSMERRRFAGVAVGMDGSLAMERTAHQIFVKSG
jgi:hypothetical protein